MFSVNNRSIVAENSRNEHGISLGLSPTGWMNVTLQGALRVYLAGAFFFQTYCESRRCEPINKQRAQSSGQSQWNRRFGSARPILLGSNCSWKLLASGSLFGIRLEERQTKERRRYRKVDEQKCDGDQKSDVCHLGEIQRVREADVGCDCG